MRIGIIGYGAVAAVHARGLHHWGADLRAVYGPNESRARAFAAANRIPQSTIDLETLFGACDAVIVASPSDRHFIQALAALHAGRHCLVELPACSSAFEARELLRAATDANVVLQCAHTMRVLPGMVRLTRLLGEGALGDIRHVVGVRAIPPRSRDWIDDAVRHHAAHYLDMILHWFGSLVPLACATHPSPERSQDAALTARLANGAPVNLSISYTSRLRENRIIVAGSEHTIVTDGFSFMESNHAAFAWCGDEMESYESAVESQDRAFLEASSGGASGIPWQDTLRLTGYLDQFLELAGVYETEAFNGAPSDRGP